MTVDVLLKMKIIAFITIKSEEIIPYRFSSKQISASSRDELLETYTNRS